MERRSGKKLELPPAREPLPQAPPQSSKPATRAAVPVAEVDYNLDVAFLLVSMFYPTNKLPTLASTVGMLRHYSTLRKGRRGGKGPETNRASREVAKILVAKWYHDTLPTIDFETLVARLEKLYQQVNTGCRDMKRKEGKKRQTVVLYKKLVDDKKKTYDIFEEDKEKRKEKEKEWGVSMGKLEEVYLADMREERKMECGGSVDLVWYQAVMKKRRQKEKEDTNKKEIALP